MKRLAAIEGMEVASPAWKPLVIPLALGVIIGLFMVQRRGTAAINHHGYGCPGGEKHEKRILSAMSLQPTAVNLQGILSLIFWTLVLVVSVKYAWVIIWDRVSLSAFPSFWVRLAGPSISTLCGREWCGYRHVALQPLNSDAVAC